MNPSRAFILRPVATSLLMVGVLLAGRRRVPAAAGLGAAGSRLPDDPGRDVLSRRQPRRDGVVGDGAARAAVRPDAGPAADDVDEFDGALGRSRCSSPRAEHRRRRAGGAAVDQRAPARICRRICRPRRSTARSNPADAPILTLALTSDTLPLSKVEDLADTRLAPKISQLPGVGLVSISGGQKPAVRIQANPTRPRRLRLEPRRRAHRGRRRQRQPGQGQLRRPAAGLHDRRQRSAALERRLRGSSSSPTGTARRSG